MKNLFATAFPALAAIVVSASILVACKPAASMDAPPKLENALAATNQSSAKEPLSPALPKPTVKGTPGGVQELPNAEPIPDKLPVFLVPRGVTNVALGKPVTSSVPPFTGELSQITDGKMEPDDSDAVEFKKGPQWVQVDLGASFPLYALVVWHDHRYPQVMKSVVFQVSDDPAFKDKVTILFNNDTENAVGQGVGTDREYFETQFGKIIDAKGVRGRYIRGYTKGGSLSALNAWQEIQAYALPPG